MARQTVSIGSVVEIQLGENLFGYGQIISRSEIAFFEPLCSRWRDEHFASDLLKPLFVISVMNNAVTTGRWKKVVKLPVADCFKRPREYFIVDKISGDIRIYRSDTGSMRAGTAGEAVRLECAAVWSAEHVEDRLLDHVHGRPNLWLTSMRSDLPDLPG